MHTRILSGTVNRGISLRLFERARDRYGDVMSWAIWDKPDSLSKAGVGNLDVLDPKKNPELLDTLHTDLILIGLNGSRRIEDAPRLSNFHDKSAKGVDYKLRHAAHGTALWGAYMTDIIKNAPITDSNELAAHLRANPRKEQENVESFRQEIEEIGAASPILVPMGRKAENIVRRSFESEFIIMPIMHYSHYIGLEKYCAEVWKIFPRSQR